VTVDIKRGKNVIGPAAVAETGDANGGERQEGHQFSRPAKRMCCVRAAETVRFGG